jgi:hypothetical protein
LYHLIQREDHTDSRNLSLGEFRSSIFVNLDHQVLEKGDGQMRIVGIVRPCAGGAACAEGMARLV